MEKIGEDWQAEKLKSPNAIRCAKAAFMLSSLKNATRDSTKVVPKFQDEEKIEMLKIELVKQKQKLKNMRNSFGVLLFSFFLLLLIYPLLIFAP